MKFKIEIDTDSEISKAVFEVYLDMKKKIFLKRQELPVSLTRVDCECDTSTKYRVERVKVQ